MPPELSFTEEIENRIAHLESLPGHQLKEDLEALKRCHYVFNTNAKKLADHIGQFLKSQQLSQDLPESYIDELVRFLHNYLTSVTSLLDSQRVAMRHRWPTTRSKPDPCPECKRPLPSKDALSKFEAEDYAAKLAETFDTGEAVFMTKLRNYCTHYSIPIPNPGTTIRWGPETSGIEQTNTLQLDRDKLLRWDSWTAPAKSFLRGQEAQFDFVPIIERYVNAANQFAAWFWSEINRRSLERIDELNTKAMELHLWQHAEVGHPDWFSNPHPQPPAGWNGRLWRAEKRQAYYLFHKRSFRLWAVDSGGSITLARDDGWTALPRFRA